MAVPIDKALLDKQLLGAALGPADTWLSWLTVLRAIFGEDLTQEDAELFAALAGGRDAPTRRVREAWLIAGRRSGKSRIAAAVASYLATFQDHKLARGETGHVLVLAASMLQAHAVFGYVRAFLQDSPILAREVVDIGREEIKLTGNVSISVHSNNYRSVRGRTLLACIFDEVAFWRDETSAAPDLETYRAILPALATTNGMLVGISSPYAKRGLLYQRHRDYFGKSDPEVLIVQAPTARLNPTISSDVIARAEADDPEAARSEWGAEFRSDLTTYIDRALVERLVEHGVVERPYDDRHRYVAFADPSGGHHDSFTLGIAHEDGKRIVLDVLREHKSPFSPADVCDQFGQLLRKYNISSVTGDRYAGEWVAQAFDTRGVQYFPSEFTKSEIYIEALPLLMNASASLLESDRFVSQISLLERRTSRAGRDIIDHPSGASDDVANAGLGALVLAQGTAPRKIPLPERKPLGLL